MKHYIISQEKHLDGNFHLHAYIELKKAIKSTKPDYLDHIDFLGTRYHPNIGSVRSLKATIRYLQKEDQRPLTDF